MAWKDYSLPHVMHDQYKRNTDSAYYKFGGDSYGFAQLSNHQHIYNSVVVAAFVLALPFWIFHLFLGWLVTGFNIILLSIVLSALDTYSTRKYRIRINVMKSIRWILNPNAHKEPRSYW